jgi:hypothetical protein
MDISLSSLLVGVLVVWRLTHLVAAEEGPGQLLVRVRARAGVGFWGSVVCCFNCLSIWIAVPLALALGSSWLDRLILWPALSGGASLLERIGRPSEAALPAVYYEGEKEETHELLRRSAHRNDAADRQ